jgi:hypothetical protein
VLSASSGFRKKRKVVDRTGLRAVRLDQEAGMAKKPKMREVRFDIVPTKHKALKAMADDEGCTIAVLGRRAINMLLESKAKEGQ